MERLIGKSVCRGIAYGKIYYHEKRELSLSQMLADDVDYEWKRFVDAREIAKNQVTDLYEKTLLEIGDKEAQIFDVHKMLLFDDNLTYRVEEKIKREKLCAEYAISIVRDTYIKEYSDIDDEYIRDRASDIQDISNRVINILLGENDKLGNICEPVILAAKELYSSDIMQLDRKNILGFITKNASEYSHVAILARTMNIPMVSDIEIESSWDGMDVVLDGEKATVIIEPDEKTLADVRDWQFKQEQYLSSLKKYKGIETVTRDGCKIDLYANISCVEDADIALKCDAEGIGLFRSEFLYLEKSDYPTEEEQFLSYKSVAEKMGDRCVRIRTLDIGADKQAQYFNLEKEENPALGFRAIRICFTEEAIFKTQIRALLRASVYGNISVIFPMIISIDEVRKAKSIYEKCKEELKSEDVNYKDFEIGIMVETPAAAIISDELAEEVDFFSIGTNDLSQYTLALDRQNPKLNAFFDEHHPAVLKLIKMIVDNGHRAGIKVGVCGELASDLSLTRTLIDMGVDELSVSPSCILSVREQIVKN